MKKLNRLALTASMLSVLLAVSGCSTGNPSSTSSNEMKTRCIDGVTYFLFKETSGYSGHGYMSPKFKRDGSLSLCDS